MPTYVNKKLQKYAHHHTKYLQHVPLPAPPVKYGKNEQKPNPPGASPYLDNKLQNKISKIVFSFLYYVPFGRP